MMETFWYLKIFSHSVYFGFLVSNLANLISKSKWEIDMSHGKKVWPNTCMVKPSNILRILNLKMEECLKKASEARKHGVALGSLQYSGDLSKEMLTCSQKLEQVFKKMQELRSDGNKDEQRYQKYFQILEEKFGWYAKAEACPFRPSNHSGTKFQHVFLNGPD